MDDFLLEQEDHDDSGIISTTDGTEVLRAAASTEEALYQVGLNAVEKNDFVKACKCFRKALKASTSAIETARVDPETLVYYLIHSHLELSAEPEDGDYAEAVKYHTQLLSSGWHEERDSQKPLPLSSQTLLTFWRDREDWERALATAHELDVKAATLAQIHYDIGVGSTTLATSLEHLNSALSLLQGTEGSDLMEEARLAIIAKHAQHEDFETAMELHDMTHRTSAKDKCRGQLQRAQLLVAAQQYDEALEALDVGLAEAGPDKTLRSTLVKAKGDLLFHHLNQRDEGMNLYQELLNDAEDSPPSEQTKLLYTLGRMAMKCGDYNQALLYSQQELGIVRHALGKTHLEVARIYQDMARMSDVNLCDYDTSLDYYKKALALYQFNLAELQHKALYCRKASAAVVLDAQIQEVTKLLRQVQKSMGRIHYKTGDFEKAVQASFGRQRR